jgi:ribosome-associated toxin RatA of RatAB toxin-antitoxin module
MEIHRSALVNHAAESMFDLIEAAEHYPAFLPWCAGATILTRDDSVVVADIVVDYHGLRFTFTTRNPKRRPEWMAITLERGPFRRLDGEWRLTPLGASGCRIDFSFRYEFDVAVIRKLAGAVFERIANDFVDAFVARADRVLGASQQAPGPSAATHEQGSLAL